MSIATKFLLTVLFIGVVCANIGARPLDKASKELMDQKPVALSPGQPQLPMIPQVPTPPLPSVPIIPGGEAAFATKGGELGNGEVPGTKVGISISRTATTNGLGAELSSVQVYTSSYAQGNGYANAAAGPGNPSADASGNGYGSTNGYVRAEGPSASAYSSSGAYADGGANAAAGPNDATANGYGYGGANTYAGGYTGNY